MKRLIILMLLLSLIISGCAAQQNSEAPKTLTEQDVRNAVTELINGINTGNADAVKKYVDAAGPVAEKLIEKLKNNIKLYNIRDVSIQGTTAQATVTLEVVPLKVKKDITLNFDATDTLMLNNPLGLLSLLI
ncbi:hypothetical protein DCCM_2487 [Desulfocucumis palustris]|uniref:DUF3887 domain-containing protein n=1 Tax=Desulfocucumis palustris TaxID=1898651 RepID=A0A2L2XGP2_9FIRM|nr:hypothetical protein [Desulfocucumis palustris]GBF33386.1 hypothetical protein DCCM_2487 [Desulfocucumis palustris]